MRVWKINDGDWVAGLTLLQALRAARRDLGCGARELIDRQHFEELPETEWRSKPCFDPEEPTRDLTLADVVAVNAPGVVMTSNY